MLNIQAKVSTVLKKKPQNAIELPDTSKSNVVAGKSYSVEVIHRQGSHTLVELGYGAGKWYIFNDHWSGLDQPQKLIKVDEGNILKSICESANAHGLPLKTQHAYIAATCYWETARTMKPVKEAYWLSEDWRRANLRYFPYYGKGYTQITWKSNYAKFSKILGIDLVNNSDLALDPDIAMFIMVYGMKHGTFTGRKLENYVNNSKTDFVGARRVINGTDKQLKIAAIAQNYLNKL